MNELDKAREIDASGDVRDQALARFRKHIAEWDIAIPDTEPLVLGFGLGRFESIGLIESWITNEIEAGYCGKYLFVSDGQTCPMHHHKQKHETFFVVQGRVNVVHDGREIELRRRDLLVVPPLTKHSFTGVGPALLLELSQPCLSHDNYFEDPRIPTRRKSISRKTGRTPPAGPADHQDP